MITNGERCVGRVLLIAVSFMLFHPWAVAAEIPLEGFEKWTSSLPQMLSRPWDAVVEAKASGNSAFEVTRRFSGNLRVGHKLLFDQCGQILIMGSTAAYLDRATETAPVVDVPRATLSRLNLPDGQTLHSFAPPKRDARFLMILRAFQAPHWAFLNQTLGDFFLIQHGKVYQLGYAYEGQSVPSIWAPIIPTVAAADFEAVLRREIVRHR